MKKTYTENTLFLGNGFTCSIFDDMPSWKDLFANVDKSIDDITLRYEAALLLARAKGSDEQTFKQELTQRIEEKLTCNNLKIDTTYLKRFGDLLMQHNFHNIITTNYDRAIELILCDICGYVDITPKSLKTETIYSIRTYKEFYNQNTRHSVKLWQIHGDFDRPKSIMLGFDQYCSSLSRLINYVKGGFRYSSRSTESSIPMARKLVNDTFDNVSWAELMFRTNVYIVGFGMGFSEIDIWWLLNKRARMIQEDKCISNTITYLYAEQFTNRTNHTAVFAAMEAFGIDDGALNPHKDYISSIFEWVK